MLSFYDALIVVGHADDQRFATRLSQRLQDYGYSVWLLAHALSATEPDGLGPIVSHAHNLLIVATTEGYSDDALEAINQAVAYHKRLFLLHPADNLASDLGAPMPANEQAKIEEFQSLTTLLHPHHASRLDPWLMQLELQLEGESEASPPSFKRLMALLQDQEAQVHEHTQILDKALTWAQHQRSPAHLLQGTDLTQATQWLSEVTNSPVPTCQPTALQREFIAESRHHADDAIASVFLAYAEDDRDLAFTPGGPTLVEALRQLLLQSGFTLWDRYYNCSSNDNDLETEIAISRATEACDNYMILLSPNAIHHAACLQGLLFALSMNKRIVPILLDTVEAEHLPEPLQSVAWVDLRGATLPLAQSPAGRQLVQTLGHEANYHRTHTQLLMAALRWERQQRHPSSLLSPKAGRTYQRWLKAAQQRQRYRPIYLQELFVAESLRQGPNFANPIGAFLSRLGYLALRFKQWLVDKAKRCF